MRYWEIGGIYLPATNEENTLIERLSDHPFLMDDLSDREQILTFRLISRGILTVGEKDGKVSVVQNNEVSIWL